MWCCTMICWLIPFSVPAILPPSFHVAGRGSKMCPSIRMWLRAAALERKSSRLATSHQFWMRWLFLEEIDSHSPFAFSLLSIPRTCLHDALVFASLFSDGLSPHAHEVREFHPRTLCIPDLHESFRLRRCDYAGSVGDLGPWLCNGSLRIAPRKIIRAGPAPTTCLELVIKQ